MSSVDAFEDNPTKVGENRFTWEKQDTSTNQGGRNRSWSLGKVVSAALLSGIAAFGGLSYCSDHQQQLQTRSTSQSSLTNHVVTGHRADYVGGRGLVPADPPSQRFKESLRSMWDTKERMASNEPAIDSVQADQLRSYDAAAATSTTLDSYLESLHQEYESMHAATDFEAWQTDRNITDNELETVKDILDTVDEETLGAYSMTELFPQEGRNRMEREQAAMKNEATYDYMLEHGGEEFVELIPAQYDSYLSFGPFQLTSWVVRGDHRVGSANSMNDYVPSRFEVPGSMKDVEGDDHIHAVYGLLAHQTTDLARELGEEKTGRLDSLDADDVALLAAGLHHRPQSTKRNVVSWASEDSSGVFGVEDLPSVSGYVSETGVNYDVLSSNRHLQRRSIKDYFSKVAEDKEWRVYRVVPSLQDRHPSVIASYFDVLDSNRGDLCDNTGNLNVVDGKHDLSVYDGSGKRWFKARCD